MTLFTHLNFQLFCRPPNCMALCLTNSRYLAISRFLQYNLYSIKNTNLTLGFIDLIYQPMKFCLTKKQHKIFKFHTIFCDCVHSPPSNSSQTHPHLLTETIYTFSLPFYLERSLYISVHIVQFVLFNYSWELGLPWDVINLPEVNHNFINKEKKIPTSGIRTLLLSCWSSFSKRLQKHTAYSFCFWFFSRCRN